MMFLLALSVLVISVQDLEALWPALFFLGVASAFNNWLWRLFVFGVSWGLILPQFPTSFVALLYFLVVYNVPLFSLGGVRPPQPVQGAVFITGCDSGMGFWTAGLLADQGYQVVAGCFTLNESQQKLKAHTKKPENLVAVALDVTSDQSVAAALKFTKARCAELGLQGLVGIINCAGMGYNGPAEYFPLSMYERQMNVNFFGYVRVVQALMPLVRAGTGSGQGERRGRVVFIGTGGGVLSPAPPLLSAYMASKWAIEAFSGCLRLELQLTEQPIDACVLNPGFVKPTALMEQGLALTKSMWAACAKAVGSDQAQQEYGDLLNTFIEYSANEPGTHVSEVAKTMVKIMAAHRPYATYKVGPDSAAAPFVGILPTAIREFIVKYSMYKKVGKV